MRKKSFSLILVLLFWWAFQANAQTTPESDAYKQDNIIEFAQSFLGKPYIFGGTTPKGFDCSGFIHFVYKHFDVNVPRTSSSYSDFGREVNLEDCQKGDIILFTGTNYNRSVIGHVGIVISDQGKPLRFIHSSSSGKHRGVTITEYQKSGYPKRYLGVRRI